MILFLIYSLIFGGSVLMAFNVYRYIRFANKVRNHGSWDKERHLLNLPIVLLALFFLGYLIVGIAGNPDLIIAGILFGGSIFVFAILLLIQLIFARRSTPSLAILRWRSRRLYRKRSSGTTSSKLKKPGINYWISSMTFSK